MKSPGDKFLRSVWAASIFSAKVGMLSPYSTKSEISINTIGFPYAVKTELSELMQPLPEQ